MADLDLRVILKFVDQATAGIKKAVGNISVESGKFAEASALSMKKASEATRELGLQMKNTGRQISSLGMTMTALGGAISTPLFLAYKEAGKFNSEIARQLDESRYTFQNLSISIATSMLPVMRSLTDHTARLVDWWNQLSKVTRDKLIGDLLKLGGALISIGLAFTVIGKSITFLSNITLLTSKLLALNPVLIGVVASLGVIILLMAKWDDFCTSVLNTMQKIAKVSWLVLNPAGARLLSPDAIFGKPGEWSKGAQDFKDHIKEITDLLAGIGNIGLDSESKKQGGTLLQGFVLGLNQAKIALGSFRDWGIQAGLDLAQGIQDNFKAFFVDAFSGQLKKAQDYFAAFGRSLINIFADVCSKIIAEWATVQIITGITKMVASVGSGFVGTPGGSGSVGQSNAGANVRLNTVYSNRLHSGGIIRAHSGLALDEVPIIAQTGERVLSRQQNKEYEGGKKGSLTINVTPVIQLWDASDISRNNRTLVNAINEAIINNQTIRRVIKEYA